jgi:hypothetical protein
MGEIRTVLSRSAEKTLKRCDAIDLTHFSGPEMQKRVTLALQLPF